MRATPTKLAWFGACALGLALATPAIGLDEPVGRRITYQGQIEASTGPAQIVFRIFDGSGTAIWGPETHDVTLDAEGRFVTLIGSTGLDLCTRVGATLDCSGVGPDGIADLDQIAAQDLELEVTVDGVTLSPRQKLIASFQASKAASVEDGIVARAALATDVLQGLVPTGAILPFGGPAAAVPGGWLLCDGQLLDQTTHPDLFAVIGTANGGGGTQFRAPDLRGEFIRGVNGGTNRDPDAASRQAFQAGGNAGDAVGSYQANQFETHGHASGFHSHSIFNPDVHSHDVRGGSSGGPSLRLNDDGAGQGTNSVDSSNVVGNIGNIVTDTDSHTHSISSTVAPVNQPNSGSSGPETRPENVYVNFIIRCGPADAC